jgi:heme/copper-type cytochrome/quinol oxidase subunit 3
VSAAGPFPGRADEDKAARRRREATPASVPAVRRGDALDVSGLPSYGFGTRSLMWWGTAGMSTIEAMGVALMILVYFDLKSISRVWPNEGPPPSLAWGTLNLVLAFISAVPNVLADKAAQDHDLHRIRRWMVIFLGIGLVMLGVRALELTALNERWDSSAYG